MLKLGFGLSFDDLYTSAGLSRLDAAFVAHLAAADAALAARLAAGRAEPQALGRKGQSDLLIALARPVEDFVAALFGVASEVTALQEAQHELAPVFACKRQVVQRKALNKYKPDDAATFDGATLRAALEARFGEPLVGQRGEIAFARHVGAWGQAEDAHAADIALALPYAASALQPPERNTSHKSAV